jgi:hypothetical protein
MWKWQKVQEMPSNKELTDDQTKQGQKTMAKKSTQTSLFVGYWRITWMDLWDQDFVDEEVEGYFEFGSNNLGSFQFGYVQGQIDYRVGTRDGKPCVEFA